MRMLVQTSAKNAAEVFITVAIFLAAAWEETLNVTYRKDDGTVVKREVAPRVLRRSNTGRLLLEVWDLARAAPRTLAVENFIASAPSGNVDTFSDLEPIPTPEERVLTTVAQQVYDEFGFNLEGWDARLVGRAGGRSATAVFRNPTTGREFEILSVNSNEDGTVISSAATDRELVALL